MLMSGQCSSMWELRMVGRCVDPGSLWDIIASPLPRDQRCSWVQSSQPSVVMKPHKCFVWSQHSSNQSLRARGQTTVTHPHIRHHYIQTHDIHYLCLHQPLALHIMPTPEISLATCTHLLSQLQALISFKVHYVRGNSIVLIAFLRKLTRVSWELGLIDIPEQDNCQPGPDQRHPLVSGWHTHMPAIIRVKSWTVSWEPPSAVTPPILFTCTTICHLSMQTSTGGWESVADDLPSLYVVALWQ